MALLNTESIIGVAEEANIGGGHQSTWADTDVVPFMDDSGLTPATESLERSNFNGSFINCPALTGNESTSGSLNVELSVKPVEGSEAGNLLGHLLFKSGLGTYVEQGADASVADAISEEADPSTNPTGYDLYRLARVGEPRTTLAVREYIGGAGDGVLDHKGVLVDSLSLDLSAGQIAMANFSVSGIAYDPLTGETPLNAPTCGEDPFVVKSAIAKVDCVAIDMQSVSLEISNTNTDRQAINSTGISDKITTAKAISLSYTLDMEDVSEYNTLKNNTKSEIYIELVNGTDEIKIYLPVVSYTEVSKNNDGGVITSNITSEGYNDDSGNAIYVATKKGA